MIPRYSLDTFKTFFRMSTTTFDNLLRILSTLPEFQHPDLIPGRPHVPLEKDLLMHLWYMGSLETVRSIADRFDVSESTFVSHNRRMIDAFCEHLLGRFIKWPCEQQYCEISNVFLDKKGFPSIIGALDGTHIKIKAPYDHAVDYINRKRYHSVILQAVCKTDLTFTDVYSGWPGRVHDARVLRNSPLWERGATLCGRHLIVADGAYPCRRWLLTPYRNNGNLTRDEVKYNQCLSGSRVVIENAFGILKGRFRRLQFIDMADIQYITKTIVNGCILHNICLIDGDTLDDYFYEEVEPEHNGNAYIADNDVEGRLQRLQITRYLAGH